MCARRRSTLAVAGLTAGVLALAACGGDGAETAGRSGAGGTQVVPVKLVTAYAPSANQLQFYWARAQGYYEDAGLDVEITSSKGSGLAVQQVAGGQFDIGQADIGTMIQANPGSKLVAFMSQTSKGTFGISVGTDTGINTWQDLYGKTVLVSSGSPETYLLPAVFGKLGLDIDQVKISNVSASAKNANYISKRAEAAGGGLPGQMASVSGRRDSNQLWFSDVLDTMDLGYFATRSYVADHPDQVKAFAQATAKATQELIDDPDAVRQAIDRMIADNKNAGIDGQHDRFRASWDNYRDFMTAPAGERMGWIDPARFTASIDVLRRYAGYQGEIVAEQAYTNDYLPN